jgi:hypothetical protein
MDGDEFPSGPWIGFYTYSDYKGRHRMDLGLTFAKGTIAGHGTDDIGSFIVRGRYDFSSKECHWVKTYVGKHDVFYKGFREGKWIWGTWEVGTATGGFKIWPLSTGEDDADIETTDKEQPVPAVGEIVGAVSSETFGVHR